MPFATLALHYTVSQKWAPTAAVASRVTLIIN